MRQANPPKAATWMLRHLVPGERNDALAGDLLEEFRSGRGAVWYWRQVLACIAVSNRRIVAANRSALFFAGLWALLAPACVPMPPLTHFRGLDHAFWNLDAIWKLAWPWSAIANLGLTFLPMILFVWAGMLLYLALEGLGTRRFSFRRFQRGIMRSVSVFIPLWVAAWSLPLIFSGVLAAHFSSEMRTVRSSPSAAHNPFALFVVTKTGFCIVCAPFFVTLLWAMWDASRVRSARKQP